MFTRTLTLIKSQQKLDQSVLRKFSTFRSNTNQQHSNFISNGQFNNQINIQPWNSIGISNKKHSTNLTSSKFLESNKMMMTKFVSRPFSQQPPPSDPNNFFKWGGMLFNCRFFRLCFLRNFIEFCHICFVKNQNDLKF